MKICQSLCRINKDENANENEDLLRAKGMKADKGIFLIGGTIKANCADNTIHSKSILTISGGIYKLEAGDGGVYVEKDLVVNSGKNQCDKKI